MPTSLRLFRSPISLAAWIAGALALTYLALIAVVMSYASLTIQFSQSVKTDEAAVAGLESQYLASIAAITGANYATLGYADPVATVYVPAAPVTALR